jgi:hypothetical protein
MRRGRGEIEGEGKWMIVEMAWEVEESDGWNRLSRA